MKSWVAGHRWLVWGAFGPLLVLTAACEVAPESAMSLTGVWMGVEDGTARYWQFVVIDVPPDEIWGTAQSGRETESTISWGLPVPLVAQRETPIVLVSESRLFRYRVDEPPTEDDPDHMGGTLIRTRILEPDTMISLALVKVQQESPD
ncbi:MAG: hypothetical protein OXL34_07225 [Gemmatimonadota bacterium]|nr:hypothetical protein [Gemmatimonadota bacterium]